MTLQTPEPPNFAAAVPQNGYRWWYVDAQSHDGRYALTFIAFVGSVFSPYYAWSRWRGRGDPEHHCAFNIALYSLGNDRVTRTWSQYGQQRWAMTERGRTALSRTPTCFALGHSAMTWDDHALTLDLDEWSAPLPLRVRGTIRFYPEAITGYQAALDEGGRHLWRPFAPLGRVEARFTDPALSWTGEGYWDCNFGSEPLEAGFLRWDWSRARVRDGTMILYDATRRRGGRFNLALLCDSTGHVRDCEPPPRVLLPCTSLWRIARATRSETNETPAIQQTLEDTPFYARSLLTTQLNGQSVTAFHESLSLRRFRSSLVRLMLPFRMPRV